MNKGEDMSWLITIVIGFIVGLIARAIMPGDQKMGIIMTTILGIVGALAAGWAGQALGWYQAGQAAGFIASVVGAIVLLFIVGLVTKKSA
jgi:uncharacterized membrane protein YeaQ/YmgE (transglycosylase-associated protein family)